VVSFICTLLHLLINWLFVEAWGWGPPAVAWANSISVLIMLLGMMLYVVMYGKGYCVWGKGVSLQAFRVRLASGLLM
jgi:Na+-driven multidrug efflux pump